MSESWERRVVLGTEAGEREEKEPSATRRSQGRCSQSRRSQAHGWHSRGYLPHFDTPGAVQHVTFHLADSLPHAAIERMQRDLEALPEEQRTLERRKRIEDMLDSGLGSCVLGHADCARIVEDTFVFGDGARYRLLAWVVMPNHVHVLIEQTVDWPLAKLVQSWKRHSAREINRLENPGALLGSPTLGSPSCTRQIKEEMPSATRRSQGRRSQALWQRDYWDRYIRDERHYAAAKEYIEQNPVKAGLVTVAGEWPWGSARLEGYLNNAEYNSAIPELVIPGARE